MAEFKHIIRVVNTDIDGNKKIIDSLRKIKGVSFMFANMICSLANIKKQEITGNLNDDQIDRLNEIIKDPSKYNAPVWMFNRRKDYETDENKHIFAGDIKFIQDNDIKRLKKIKTYRGIRHMANLPVRGQRTKANFRKNKGKVLGVKRRPGAKGGR